MRRKETTRATVYLDDRPLAVLACKPTSADLNATLELQADLIEAAGLELAIEVTGPEWGFLLAAFECRELTQDVATPQFVAWIRENVVYHASVLRSEGELDGSTGEALVDGLLAKIAMWSPTDALAAIYALAFGTVQEQLGELPGDWYSPYRRIRAWMERSRVIRAERRSKK